MVIFLYLACFILSFRLNSDRHGVCVEVAHLVTLRASWGINHSRSSSLCGISLLHRNAQLADFCLASEKQIDQARIVLHISGQSFRRCWLYNYGVWLWLLKAAGNVRKGNVTACYAEQPPRSFRTQYITDVSGRHCFILRNHKSKMFLKSWPLWWCFILLFTRNSLKA